MNYLTDDTRADVNNTLRTIEIAISKHLWKRSHDTDDTEMTLEFIRYKLSTLPTPPTK